MNIRDFERQGKDINFRLGEEIFKKDKVMQQQLKDQFTSYPPAFREQMERIEAGAKGFTIQDGYPVNNQTGEPASEMEYNSIQQATDSAMLRQNPEIERNNLRYENGFFIPLDYKKLLEKER